MEFNYAIGIKPCSGANCAGIQSWALQMCTCDPATDFPYLTRGKDDGQLVEQMHAAAIESYRPATKRLESQDGIVPH